MKRDTEIKREKEIVREDEGMKDFVFTMKVQSELYDEVCRKEPAVAKLTRYLWRRWLEDNRGLTRR